MVRAVCPVVGFVAICLGLRIRNLLGAETLCEAPPSCPVPREGLRGEHLRQEREQGGSGGPQLHLMLCSPGSSELGYHLPTVPRGMLCPSPVITDATCFLDGWVGSGGLSSHLEMAQAEENTRRRARAGCAGGLGRSLPGRRQTGSMPDGWQREVMSDNTLFQPWSSFQEWREAWRQRLKSRSTDGSSWS